MSIMTTPITSSSTVMTVFRRIYPGMASSSSAHVGGYPRRMHDLDIRLELDRVLRERFSGDDDVVIRHELGLEEGRRRIDVAVLNGHLSGWEIKSDADTLTRLAGQADAYGRVFDYVTIVTTDRYLDKATAKLPTWWGLVVAQATEVGVELAEVRAATSNDAVNGLSLVQLLWREEAMVILREHGLARGLSGKARWYVWNRLADSFALEELKQLVRGQLKARQEWTGGQLPSAGDATLRTTAIR